MELLVAKYGNLMGSPDLKAKLYDSGSDTPEADRLFDQLFDIKVSFGLNGQSTSLILLDPSRPDLFPAVVDFSFINVDSSSHNESSVKAALDSLASFDLKPEDIKSALVTHPHGDHHDPRLCRLLTNAKIYADPDSKIPGAEPLPDCAPAPLVSMNTPGHGTPHCSFIVDIVKHDLSVFIAGDLIMSHAHYLSLEKPLAFSQKDIGLESVKKGIAALNERPTKFKMIMPGHDIPFFV